MGAWVNEYKFKFYKWFHNPPGTPKELKCVACKQASGSLALVGAMAMFNQARKRIVLDLYKGTFCALAGSGLVAISLIAFRLAHEEKIYNEKLMKDMKAMKQKRKEEQ